jgi:hypothetical protein
MERILFHTTRGEGGEREKELVRLRLLTPSLFLFSFVIKKIKILTKNSKHKTFTKKSRLLSKVAWSDLCYPKKEGGLGLKDLHVWSLFASSGSLWVAWIHNYMLKGKSFWCVKIPQNCSWCWRKILKLRGIAKSFLKHEIGDGKSIHLWIDNWHPSGVLVERYGYRIVYDSQSRLDARLDSVIRNGNWCWKPAHSDSLVEIQSKLSEIRFGVADKPIWTISRSGSYSSSDTWDQFHA